MSSRTSETKGSSGESAATTLSEALARSLVLKKLLDEEAAQDILKRTLSVGTVNSTKSSHAERKNAARYQGSEQITLRDIGRGSCGSVFEIPGTAQAVKKGARTLSIWNDFNLTNTAYNSYLTWVGIFRHQFPDRRVPRVPMARYFNGPESEEFWIVNLKRFPFGDQIKAAAFHVHRILPVPELTREALIRKFFKDDKETQFAALANPENKDCLIRVYLGQNNPNPNRFDSSDTLRNFPLYLDQAKMIGLDVEAYAEEMATGLAILHWDAEVDSQDTEFVIGSSTTTTFGLVYSDHTSTQPPTSTMDDFTHRETQLWMFDYDKCAKVDLHGTNSEASAVKKFFVAVTGNDPYFPHPALDRDLWQVFRATYLKASTIIIKTRRLGKKVAQMPNTLMDDWENWGDKNVEAGEFDPFERADEEDGEDNDVWSGEDEEEDPEEESEDDEDDENEDDDDET